MCKIRKTRCELPDLQVPSSSTPLPLDKACHRCKILAIPCVVDDTTRRAKVPRPNKRQRVKDTESEGQSTKSKGTPKSAGAVEEKRARTSGSAIDHTLDVLHDMDPPHGSTANTTWSQGGTPPQGESEALEAPRTNSIKFHGRPLELLCVMLRVAYGKRTIRRGESRQEIDDLDLSTLVDPELKPALEIG